MKLSGLKYIRKEFGLTMRELAKQLGVSHNAINIWENGEVEISDNNLKHLTYLFDLGAEYFFKAEFNYEDKMMIEMARSRYKVEQYKRLIVSDKKTTKEIINKLTQKSSLHKLECYDQEETNMILETLLEKVIEVYSSIKDNDIFYDADDAIRKLVDVIIEWDKNYNDYETDMKILTITSVIEMMGVSDENYWKLDKIHTCLADQEGCPYSLVFDKDELDLSAEQALWKNILTNLDVLYRLSRKEKS